MAKGKKRPEAHITGDLGVEILKRQLPVEWVAREYHPDYGIDLSVELFEKVSLITKGAHLFFQVKSTEHLERSVLGIKNRSNVEKPPHPVEAETYTMEVVKYTLDTDFIATVERMGSGVPVILAVVDISNQEVYFLCLSDYVEKILIHEKDYRLQDSKTVYIPLENKLDERGLEIIEWYAKRPRFYALFNKIHYQKSELEYVSQYEISNYIDHFIRIISRFDVWDEPTFIPFMKETKAEIDYYLQHGITKIEEQIVNSAIQRGEDVDAEIWEATYCDVNREVSFREAQRVQGLHRLWDKLSNLGDVFEETSKEAFLPTAFWCSMKM